MTIVELGALTCPQCTARCFETYSLEETTQHLCDGGFGDTEFTDESFIVFVKCKPCGHILLDCRTAVKCAVREIVFEQPERERQAAELEKWITEKGWDLPEGEFDEAIHDYFSGQASNALNGGEALQCLVEIYGFDGAKDFIESCAT